MNQCNGKVHVFLAPVEDQAVCVCGALILWADMPETRVLVDPEGDQVQRDLG